MRTLIAVLIGVLIAIGCAVVLVHNDTTTRQAPAPVLKSVLRGWIAMVETMGRGWLRQGQPTREELETLLPELLRAVLGAAAWHDPATAAVLPRLPRVRAT